MNWLLGPAGPWVAGAALAVLLALGGYGIHEHLKLADMAVQLAQAQSDNAGLRASVERQNGEVDRVGRDCQAKADAAVADAMRALNASAPPANGSGPQSLNAWLRARLR